MTDKTELKKRPGCFLLHVSFLDRDELAEEIMRLIFSKMFIVKCECDYFTHSFVYHAYSMLFDVVEEECGAQTYMFTTTKKEDGSIELEVTRNDIVDQKIAEERNERLRHRDDQLRQHAMDCENNND